MTGETIRDLLQPLIGQPGTILLVLSRSGQVRFAATENHKLTSVEVRTDGLVRMERESGWTVIEPAEGVEPGDELAQEILAFCSDKLAKFKMPKTIDFTNEMPRDPNGKLYKRKLRDPYWEGRQKI